MSNLHVPMTNTAPTQNNDGYFFNLTSEASSFPPKHPVVVRMCISVLYIMQISHAYNVVKILPVLSMGFDTGKSLNYRL